MSFSSPDLRLGNLEVRLAQDEQEIIAAQELRYQVFYKEMAAHPSDEMRRLERDFDVFDPLCDHLLVIDTDKKGKDAIVGTYRMSRRSQIDAKLGFYSAQEFDLKPILDLPGEIVEMGRSCVAANYRTRSAMQLLWRGIAAYVFHYNIQMLFGCASFPGIDPKDHALPLSYLYYHHLAPPAFCARALESRYEPMNLIPAKDIDERAAINLLPPLIKGYLRLGGMVGDGAIIDTQFSCVDVCVMVKTDQITEKYFKHYERVAGGFNAGEDKDIGRKLGNIDRDLE